MSLIHKVLGSKPALPALNDPVLGPLLWDSDSGGWARCTGESSGEWHLYIGFGSANEYPSEDTRALLRAPYSNLASLKEVALTYLKKNADLEPILSTLEFEALESYDHYLPEATYTLISQSKDRAADYYRMARANRHPEAYRALKRLGMEP